MKVAILGGTRFIGPFIVRRLVQEGHEVQIYHRGKTTSRFTDGLQHIKMDRDIPGQTATVLKENKPEAIIDMIGFRAEQIEEVIDADLNLKHYVFCGSTSVYGQIGKSTPGESALLKPSSPYELGKVACEQSLLKAQKSCQMPVTILRLAHPEGPGDHLLYVTGREALFLDRIRHNRPIVIPNEGFTRIHPIFVEDAAEAFIHVLGRSDCIGHIYNLSGEQVLSVNEYFESIAKVLGKSLIAEHIPTDWLKTQDHLWAEQARKFDFAITWPKYPSAFDVTALQATGFKCRTNHEQAAAATITWLDKEQLIPKSSDNDLEDILINQASQAGII